MNTINNNIKVPVLKPLQWWDDKPRPYDGKINCSNATDDVWVHGKERVYISYYVTRGASKETDNKWYIRISFPATPLHEEVSSMEEGKIICAHYRKLFWEEFYREMMKKIFE